MASVSLNRTIGLSAHPNEFDRRRIERALKTRKRYRYVSPSVMSIEDGYRIESPCCSRNVDPDGGIVDVALLLHDAGSARWRLFRKDHQAGKWLLDSTHDRLLEALQLLSEDPERAFWQ